MAFSDVSQKYDVIIRIFEILKYQNILALTVWPIVPITFLVRNNHQSGRLAAKNSNSAEIAFFTFWSNVTLYMLLTVSTKPVLSVVFLTSGRQKTLLLSASVKTPKLTRLHAEIVSSWLGLSIPRPRGHS